MDNLIVVIIAEKGDKIAGFLFEPIQGEAGVGSFVRAIIIFQFILLEEDMLVLFLKCLV